MNIPNSLQKVVVDRGGLPYSSYANDLGVANRPETGTEERRVPKLLANQCGPETRLAPRPGPELRARKRPMPDEAVSYLRSERHLEGWREVVRHFRETQGQPVEEPEPEPVPSAPTT